MGIKCRGGALSTKCKSTLIAPKTEGFDSTVDSDLCDLQRWRFQILKKKKKKKLEFQGWEGDWLRVRNNVEELRGVIGPCREWAQGVRRGASMKMKMQNYWLLFWTIIAFCWEIIGFAYCLMFLTIQCCVTNSLPYSLSISISHLPSILPIISLQTHFSFSTFR